jgi:hypothetical protein
MNDSKGKRQPDVGQRIREARDVGLEVAARVVLGVTSSAAYSRVSSSLARPGLIAAAIARRKTDQAMRKILSHINMPSRSDVLGLSTRLTHIEMTLDDLSAAVDSMRATRGAEAAPASGPARAARRGGSRRAQAQGE